MYCKSIRLGASKSLEVHFKRLQSRMLAFGTYFSSYSEPLKAVGISCWILVQLIDIVKRNVASMLR